VCFEDPFSMRPVDSRMCRVPNGCRGKTDTSSDGRGGVSVVGRLVCVTKMKEKREVMKQSRVGVAGKIR
jgi:hypothetical protein